MKSLFVRIFLSFWIAQALFVVLAILVTVAFRPRASTWEALRTTVLNDAVTAYEESGGVPLSRFRTPSTSNAGRGGIPIDKATPDDIDAAIARKLGKK